MSKSFIRGIWGVYNNSKKLHERRTKIDKDIKLAMLNPYSPKSKVYVFGEDNFKRMIDLGFDCRLVDKRPCAWDMDTEQYRHKIEIWKDGLADFDEIVFLDWDCVPVHPIPNDFWDVLGKGEKIQSTIYMYKLCRARFRPFNERKLSASTFVYMRGKEIANEIIRVWEKIGRPWQEEVALSKYIDDLDGGWKDIESYKKYEPKFHCLFWHYKDYSDLKVRPPIFYHYGTRVIGQILAGKTQEKIKKSLDNLYNKQVSIIKSIK